MFPAGSRLKGRAVVSNSSEQDRPIFASMSKSTDPRPPESRFLGIPERGPYSPLVTSALKGDPAPDASRGARVKVQRGNFTVAVR